VLTDVVTRVLVRLSQVINSSPQFAVPIHRFLSVNETSHLTSLPSCAPIPLHSLYGCMPWTGTALSLPVLPADDIATAMGRTVWGSNPGGGKIFCTHPDRLCGPHSLLYNRYRVFPGGKVAGAWHRTPTPI